MKKSILILKHQDIIFHIVLSKISNLPATPQRISKKNTNPMEKLIWDNLKHPHIAEFMFRFDCSLVTNTSIFHPSTTSQMASSQHPSYSGVKPQKTVFRLQPYKAPKPRVIAQKTVQLSLRGSR